MSLGYAFSVQLRGASYCSPGNTLTATGMETPLALKKPPLYSQWRREAETPVFVSQYSVMLSRISSRVSSPVALVVRFRAEATAAAGWPSASLWSRSQAARPTGESAMPYKVCGRVAGLEGLVDVSWNGGRHVGVDGEQSRRCLQAHLVDDKGTPVAALGDVAGVAEALHQLCPGSAHALGAPAGAGWLARKPVARHRWNHHIESVRCAPAVCRGIDKWIDDLKLLDDRAGPSVRDDERQHIFMFRTNVNEMNVQPIDLGDEVR